MRTIYLVVTVIFTRSPIRSFLMSSSTISQKRIKTGQASLTAFFGSKPAATTRNDGDDEGNDKDTKKRKTNRQESESIKKEDSLLDPIIPEKVKWSERLWNLHKDCILYRRSGETTASRTKVAAFDMDGTLLTWRTQGGWPSELSDYELWNPSVIDKLQHLYDYQNYQLIIITNQGGIRKAMTGKIATKVKALTEWLIIKVGRPISVIMSTSKHSGYHKPSVKLWDLAQRLFFVVGNKNNDDDTSSWDIAESFFVGDSIVTDDDPQGGVDETLARNVSEKYGIALSFYTPTDYFGPSTSALRHRGTTLAMEEDAAILPETIDERARLHSGVIRHPILLLLCGAQGSGKSTLAQQLLASSFEHVSQDTIRDGKAGTRQQVEEAVRTALTKFQHQQSMELPRQKSIVLDRMHLDAIQRAIFIQIAQECGDIPVHTLTFDLPADVLAKRVLERQHHIVTGESGAKLARQSASRLVRPRFDEGIVLRNTLSHPGLVNRFVKLYNGNITIPTHFPIIAATSDEVLQMPAVILGTMGIGRRIVAETVSHAIQTIGLQGIDTAPTYNNEDLMPETTNVFCVVKVPKRVTSADDVISELDSSLTKLRRNYADLLLLHWPAGETTKIIWEAMETAAKTGKAKALGVCNFNVSALSHLLSFCAIRPSVVQVERHPRLAQWELVDFCHQHDLQIQAHTPLGQGYIMEHEVVQDIAKKYGQASPAQVALAWNLQQGVAVVPKCTTQTHQQELLSIPYLSSDDLLTLNNLSKTSPKRFVAPPFMYGPAAYCWGTRFPKSTTQIAAK